MQFLEKDLEQIIYETRNEILQEKELYISGIKKRQLRIGNYGVADIVTFRKPTYCPKDKDGYGGFYPDPFVFTIYELKQNKISVSSFLQSIRYAKGIKNYLNKRNFKPYYEINICLIGKDLDLSSEFVYLTDFFDNLSLITYDYCVDGITFKDHYNYCLTNEGF